MDAQNTIAVTTEDIVAGAIGRVTTYGLVHNVNTGGLTAYDAVYVAPSDGYTGTKPSYPNTAVRIGYVFAISPTVGTVFVDIKSEEFKKGFDVMKQPLGVYSRGESTITYASGTQTFQIAPVSSYWAFFNKGIEYRVTTVQSLPHTATTGGHFFYISGNTNALTVSTLPWDLIVDIPLCYVYYNATTGEGYAFEERHGATRNPEWHRGQHINIGTYYVSGLAATGYTLTSDVNANIQFGIDAGIIRDEDISDTIAGQTDGGTYNIFWRSGVNGDWRITTSSMPYLTGTTYSQYNQYTGAIWQMTDLTGGDFMNVYVVAIPAINGTKTIVCIPSQVKYSALGNATNATFTQDIQWGTIPVQEFSVIHRFTMRTGAGYTSTGRTRIEAYSDSRGTTTRIQVSGAAASSHNGLAGLNDGNFIHLTAAQFASLVYEAPIDGNRYVRQNGAWVVV